MKHPDLHDLLNDPGPIVQKLCQHHDITREKLAELTGLSTCQISKLANGKSDSKTSTMRSIAYAFGILRRPNQPK